MLDKKIRVVQTKGIEIKKRMIAFGLIFFDKSNLL